MNLTDREKDLLLTLLETELDSAIRNPEDASPEDDGPMNQTELEILIGKVKAS